MPDDATKHGEAQPGEIASRLERLEATVANVLDFLKLHGREVLAKFPGGYFVLPSDLFPTFREWPTGLIFVPALEQPRLEPAEWPAPPWKHLIRRSHPWRRQLYVKGRNMTVRQLIGTVKANKLSPEEAAADLDLPVEAIREALAYAEENAELLKLETDVEALLLKREKARGSAAVPR